MLDADLKNQLQTYLGHLKQPIELVATLDGSPKAKEMQELLQEIAELSDKITLREDPAADVRKPSFAINRIGTDIELNTTVDPSVVGGVRVCVRDLVMDSTVRSNVAALRTRLTS